MTTIRNTSGTKAVNITNNSPKTFRAMYVQIYCGQEQVLESKVYSTLKAATKYANSKLN